MTRASVPRALVNPHADPGRVPESPTTEAPDFHRGMSGYEPTPLHRLNSLVPGVAEVYLKDESARLGLPAFKILGASWAVERTLRARPETRTLVAASAGNHGRAVARAARERGLAARIYLPRSASRARAAAIESEGAEVVYVEGDYTEAVATAAGAARANDSALIADTSEDDTQPSATWVIEGYATLFAEAIEQAPGPFDIVCVPVGVGSLAAAAVLFAANESAGAAVIGVEPTAAACVTASLQAGSPTRVETSTTAMTGMRCETPSFAAWPLLRAGLTGTITVGDDEVRREMRLLADLGLAIGECGAAPTAALRALVTDEHCADLRHACGLGPDSRVLCVATEGPTDPETYAEALANP